VDTGHAKHGQQPQHRPVRRGQQHIAARLPRRLPHPKQRPGRVAVDEVQVFQVDDQLLPAAASAATPAAVSSASPVSSSPRSGGSIRMPGGLAVPR
jgi:hypothetical protein